MNDEPTPVRNPRPQGLPLRRLADYCPDDATEDEAAWLARWEAAAWVRDYPGPGELAVHGRWVHRYAMRYVGPGSEV